MGKLITRRTFIAYAAVAAGAAMAPTLAGCASPAQPVGVPGSAQQPVDPQAPKEPQALEANDVAAPFASARLLVLGDTHVAPDFAEATAHMRAAFAAIGQFDPAPHAIVLNGDVVNHGLDAEYDLLETLAAEASYAFPDRFIVGMGDHEQWGSIPYGAAADYAAQRETFLRRCGLQRLYYDTRVNDAHLVVLGPDANPRRWDTLNFSSGQLQWLDAQLAADADAGARTFVFMHAPANDTVAYTFDGELKRDSLDASAAFLDVVSKYPQAIIISSHTHSLPDFQRPRQDGPLFVSTGAVAYLRPDAHTDWSDAGLGYSHGLLVDVHHDRTEFTPWDFVLESAGEGGYSLDC